MRGILRVTRLQKDGDHRRGESKALAELEQLSRVLEGQYSPGEDGEMSPRRRRQAMGDVITAPHDLEVRRGCKGGQATSCK